MRQIVLTHRSGISAQQAPAYNMLEATMSKGYWVVIYRQLGSVDSLKGYSEVAMPAVKSRGARFIARGGRVAAFEAAEECRTTLIEFDSYEDALAAYKSNEYRAALSRLGSDVVREVRVVEGLIG